MIEKRFKDKEEEKEIQKKKNQHESREVAEGQREGGRLKSGDGVHAKEADMKEKKRVTNS